MSNIKTVQAITDISLEDAANVKLLSKQTGFKIRHIYNQAIVNWVKSQLEEVK